ncbi:unnamed protein product [Schistocephalus solidus]|uniref:Succinate dehydrogenase assembly factor 4, mitochondrial n=1 Tax=Schistocephalus solidus TaxID=70667 RepID=A0A183TL09_SCHSO|nr:unnamed protein product [Schistocephalus solidus]
MQRSVRAVGFLTSQLMKKPANVSPNKCFYSTCDDEKSGIDRKLKIHPDAEKEPLERFPDDINPLTGERGGPRGPEPTRYGDWERKGRCIDF